MSARPEATPEATRKRTTILTLQRKREEGELISMLTAYDYPTARAVDAAGVDAILVGDSLAMVVLGQPDTLAVTVEEMLHHAKAVSRAAPHALLIGDLPFMSYQADVAEAVRNAGRFLKEAGMDAVKLEGGRDYAGTISAIVKAGIPVQGHIGLRPQSMNMLGGYRVQGRTAPAARELLEDALALDAAGCFSIVLEGIPDRLATYITNRLTIPTIGIGAGGGTSGQVLVVHDILGLCAGRSPRFVKTYTDLYAAMSVAIERYRDEVGSRAFPGSEHSYGISDEEWAGFLATVEPKSPPRPRRVK